ncbi:xylose isomerase [Striga asiatica]|uniref:Xylose isomerase n=1 Tax=Striga asiatica TaxID=4170 RepID=A0A5A7R2Z1_STRAF|nr:xylose isomerase [Striga asiatica]
MGFPARFRTSAVVMMADLIAAGDQSGCVLLSSAATPLRSATLPGYLHLGLKYPASKSQDLQCWVLWKKRQQPLDINKRQKILRETLWLVSRLAFEELARSVSQHHSCPQLPVHSTRANSESPGYPIHYTIVVRAIVSRRDADNDTMLHRSKRSYRH